MVSNPCEKDPSCANSADRVSGGKDGCAQKGGEMEGEQKETPPVSSAEEKKGSGAAPVLNSSKDDAPMGEATPQEGPSGVAGEKKGGKESGQLSGGQTAPSANLQTAPSANLQTAPSAAPPADPPTDEVCVKRIINVEITEEIKSFLETFSQRRDQIIDWCDKNKDLYASKINTQTSNFLFQKAKHIHLLLTEESINIDTLNVLLYFYNLYCTHNNLEKINAHSVVCTSCITYRGIYENINQNSKAFKNLLKEEKAYKKLIGKTNHLNDFFSNYKKTCPYGINLILGIFLTFLSGYYGSLLLGFTKFTTRLICGIVFSYVTLILEVIIFIIINEKVENLKRSQKSAGSNYGLYEKVYIKEGSGGKGEVDDPLGEAELVPQAEVQEMKGVADEHPTLKQRRKG
ncbi:conserved Plasmodium protein, unknown function [Plasmodium vivax]|uniref:Uncharacterized protein n=1 Tax=Plasmodium vivax TaxID=5855 RepID=A0A565A207_PLAVI|nr:conserved Plasmodium protein, unknown function [Plasmodium vivax]